MYNFWPLLLKCLSLTLTYHYIYKGLAQEGFYKIKAQVVIHLLRNIITCLNQRTDKLCYKRSLLFRIVQMNKTVSRMDLNQANLIKIMNFKHLQWVLACNYLQYLNSLVTTLWCKALISPSKFSKLL